MSTRVLVRLIQDSLNIVNLKGEFGRRKCSRGGPWRMVVVMSGTVIVMVVVGRRGGAVLDGVGRSRTKRN